MIYTAKDPNLSIFHRYRENKPLYALNYLTKIAENIIIPSENMRSSSEEASSDEEIGSEDIFITSKTAHPVRPICKKEELQRLQSLSNCYKVWEVIYNHC